jgi:hypothetical protein
MNKGWSVHVAGALLQHLARPPAGLDHRRGPTPLIATALCAHWQSGYAITAYIAVCAAIGLFSAAAMPDCTGKDLSVKCDGT